MNESPWDQLASKFSSANDPESADNVVIAYPVFVQRLKSLGSLENRRVLDFGCGAGGLCEEYRKLGCEVMGIDMSAKMIELAKRNYRGIEFRQGGLEELRRLEEKQFDFISALHAFPFIKERKEYLDVLTRLLSRGGILAISEFNPEYARKARAVDYLFANSVLGYPVVRFSEGIEARFYEISENDLRKLYVRDFKDINVVCPPFPEGFKEKYGRMGPTDLSEFMIISGVKK